MTIKKNWKIIMSDNILVIFNIAAPVQISVACGTLFLTHSG